MDRYLTLHPIQIPPSQFKRQSPSMGPNELMNHVVPHDPGAYVRTSGGASSNGDCKFHTIPTTARPRPGRPPRG